MTPWLPRGMLLACLAAGAVAPAKAQDPIRSVVSREITIANTFEVAPEGSRSTVSRQVTLANTAVAPEDLSRMDGAVSREVSLHAPTPDLAVLSIVPSPPVGDVGTAGAIFWTVENRGRGTAPPPWLDRVWLSKDQTPGGDTLLGDVPYGGPPLGPDGGSYTGSLPFALPDTYGQYWIIVQTGIGGSTNDEISGNDRLVGDVTLRVAVRPAPDLVVEVDSPGSGLAGSVLEVSFVVTNGSSDPTFVPSWMDSVFLTRTPDLEPDLRADPLLAHVPSLRALGPGESYRQTLFVTLPEKTEGEFHIAAYTDSRRANTWTRGLAYDQEEVIESNNWSFSEAFRIEVSDLQPDLEAGSIVLGDEDGDSVASSTLLVVSWTDRNVGEADTDSGLWVDAVYLSTNPAPTVGPGDWLVGTRIRNGTPLAFGQGASLSVSRALPADLGGTYHVKVAVDIQDHVCEYGYEDNNVTVRSRLLQVVRGPSIDLAPVRVSPAAEGYPGQEIAVEWEVDNIGAPPGDLPRTWLDALYLSEDAAYDPGVDIHLGSFARSTGRDASGKPTLASYTETASVRLPADTPEGARFIIAVADHTNVVFEGTDLPGPEDDDLKEGNNVLASSLVTIRALSPDLSVVPSPSVPRVSSAGKRVPVAWTVTNAGPVPAQGNWTDGVFFSEDAIRNAGDRPLRTDARTGGLAPGGSYTVERTVVMPSVPAGEYFLLFAADIGQRVHELSPGETNDVAALPMTIDASAADLSIVSAAGPSSARGGEAVLLEWTVRNGGDLVTPSALWSDSVYLSADAILDGSDRLVGSRTRSDPLEPSSSYSVSRSFRLPRDVSGTFRLILAADARDAVFEVDESNNALVLPTPIVVSPALLPNLAASGVGVTGVVISGQPVNVSWTVSNTGIGPTVTRWQDSVYLSADRALDPSSDIFLGSRVRLGVLDPGESYGGVIGVRLPLGVNGAYFVLVAADRAGKNDETVTSDNLAVSPVQIQVPLPRVSDLAVSAILHPVEAAQAEPIRIEWRIENRAGAPVEGSWRDALYLSADDRLDIEDAPLGNFESAPGAALLAGEGASFEASPPIPPLEPGQYHVLVLADIFNHILEDGASNLGVSAGTVRVTMPALVLDGPEAAGTLAPGDVRCFALAAPAGSTVRIDLDHADPDASTELLVDHESVPTRGRFELRSQAVGDPDQVVTIPRTNAGTYFVCIRSIDGGPGGDSTYSLRATTLPFLVGSARPARIGDTGRVTLTVLGGRLDDDVEISLEGGGAPPLEAWRTRRIDLTRMEVTFVLSDERHGPRNVVARRSDGAVARLDGAVTVEETNPPILEVAAPDPPALRPGASAGTFEHALRNRGNVDAEYVFLASFLEAGPGREVIHRRSTGLEVHGAVRGELHTASTIVRSVPPGERAFIAMTARAGHDAGDAIPVGQGALVVTTDAFLELHARAAEACRLAALEDPALLLEEGRDIPLTLASDPAGWLDHWLRQLVHRGLVEESDIDAWTGSAAPVPGRAECLSRSRVEGTLEDFCFGMEDRFAAEWTERLVETGSEATGFFERSPGAAASARIAIDADSLVACAAGALWAVKASIDPNEKTGSEGVGEEGYVPAGGRISYRIYFENLEDADAPAAQVRITDRLDPSLNPGSFRLGNIAFGGTVVEVPADQVFFQRRIGLTGELLGLSLLITAGLDADTNEAFWTLSTVDSISGLPPGDARLGFLPPTDETGAGLGWVEFAVEPKPAADDGIIILNDAAITFDDNEPITTNVTEHTLDAATPRSRVEPLVATIDDPAIPLRWDLEDPGAEPGLAGFAIFVSVDGGSFTPFISGTTETSAVYPGEPGRTYAFYSVAMDHAGNEEAAPQTPDAETTVRGGAVRFRRGEVNLDGRVDISDAVRTLSFLFLGGAPIGCMDAADSDDNGNVNITDPIYLLNHLFLGGRELPPPGIDACGEDPSADELEPCGAVPEC